MKKIITTVGTSLLTNYLEKNSDIKSYYNAIKDKSYSKYNEEIKRVKRIKDKLIKFVEQENSCAELTSITKLQEKYGEIEVYLIATDTIESVIVCEILNGDLKKILKEKKITIFFDNNYIIEKLRVDLKANFEKGIDNLIDKLFNIIEKKDGVYTKDSVIFNITGGYKGIIPYFSAIAQIFNYEIVYTFEDKESELIFIKPLPIEIDRGLLELYYPYLDNLELIKDEREKELKKLGLYNDNKITPLGKIVLKTVKKTPLAKDVFGHFIEYKVYEYFIEKYFKQNFIDECLDFEYQKVGHGVPLGKSLTDIDIMLENNQDIVWVEVKPISYLIDKFNREKLITQIRDKQLAKWNESKFKDKSLKKYMLVVYLYNKDVLSLVTEEIRNKFQELFGELDFDLCYFEIKLTKSDKREQTITSSTYQTLMKDLQIKTLKRITNV